MANCFLCHRKSDAALVERLAVELRNAGHQVWFDEWEIGIGGFKACSGPCDECQGLDRPRQDAFPRGAWERVASNH